MEATQILFGTGSAETRNKSLGNIPEKYPANGYIEWDEIGYSVGYPIKYYSFKNSKFVAEETVYNSWGQPVKVRSWKTKDELLKYFNAKY